LYQHLTQFPKGDFLTFYQTIIFDENINR